MVSKYRLSACHCKPVTDVTGAAILTPGGLLILC